MKASRPRKRATSASISTILSVPNCVSESRTAHGAKLTRQYAAAAPIRANNPLKTLANPLKEMKRELRSISDLMSFNASNDSLLWLIIKSTLNYKVSGNTLFTLCFEGFDNVVIIFFKKSNQNIRIITFGEIY